MQDRQNQMGSSGDGSGPVLITLFADMHAVFQIKGHVNSVIIICQGIRQQNHQKWQPNNYKQLRLILIIIPKSHIWSKN